VPIDRVQPDSNPIANTARLIRIMRHFSPMVRL
jgi:hypothetical protein